MKELLPTIIILNRLIRKYKGKQKHILTGFQGAEEKFLVDLFLNYSLKVGKRRIHD